MPIIRVNCPNAAHSSEHKATLAPRLVQALIRQEIDPFTEIGTAATGFFFNELDRTGYLHMFAAGPDDRSNPPSATARRASRTRNVP